MESIKSNNSPEGLSLQIVLSFHPDGFVLTVFFAAFSLRLQLNSSHVFFLSFLSLVDSLLSWCPVYSITSSILALRDPLFLLLFSVGS
ncbi:hypothetical protein E4U60_007300 [Claviceps pazoutovae]|uniref:Uncharacterized protein n=1 Tax=Claviceps pazoutovae TaxID=1649127 RepID=A0A9P7MG35_9HYPO|nr:hypothetical protein E4U60_007300 [Claviceps pazoutovae]